MPTTRLIPTLQALAVLAVCVPSPVSAQGYPTPYGTAQSASAPAMTPPAQPQQDPMLARLAPLQNEWARIKYQVPDKDSQLAAIARLETAAAQLSAAYPAQAEPKIWEAIILSTEAGIVKGLSALPKVKKAKELLETAQQINPNALDGSIFTSLGSLYYQVPGWPVAFGDDEKAEQYLKYALRLNPMGIDPNYFYGDFLLQNGRADEAREFLQRALDAPARAGRELADAGRRQEAKAALAKIRQTVKNKDGSDFN